MDDREANRRLRELLFERRSPLADVLALEFPNTGAAARASARAGTGARTDPSRSSDATIAAETHSTRRNELRHLCRLHDLCRRPQIVSGPFAADAFVIPEFDRANL